MDNKNIENLQNIAEKVDKVDDNIYNLLIPLLKDTIKDGNTHNKRLYTISICLLITLLLVTAVSIILFYKQNVKYQEFINQFEFETTQTVYQDLDSGEGDILNPTINNKR